MWTCLPEKNTTIWQGGTHGDKIGVFDHSEK